MLISLMLACAKLPPSMTPAEAIVYETADGWRNELRRYLPFGEANAEGPPVLLVHGMSANHYNWDYREEVSLAAHLQAEGWDVWIPAMRGDPRTAPPDEGRRGQRRAMRTFTFDDFAYLDLPAAVDAVLEITGAERLSWVGHSMGGMLLYVAMSAYPEKIQAGVAISSPAVFSEQPPLHRLTRSLSWAMVGEGRVRNERLVYLTPVWGGPIAYLAQADNLDPGVTRGLRAEAVIPTTRAMSRQTAGWLRAGALVDRDGAPMLEARPDGPPLMVLSGGADHLVPWENARGACEIFTDCEWVLADPSAGFSRRYGHLDVVLGETAPEEIYPLVVGFLGDHRGGSGAPSEAGP